MIEPVLGELAFLESVFSHALTKISIFDGKKLMNINFDVLFYLYDCMILFEHNQYSCFSS